MVVGGSLHTKLLTAPEDATRQELCSTAMALLGTALVTLSERTSNLVHILEACCILLTHHLEVYLGSGGGGGGVGEGTAASAFTTSSSLTAGGAGTLDPAKRRELLSACKRPLARLESSNTTTVALSTASQPVAKSLVSLLQLAKQVEPVAIGGGGGGNGVGVERMVLIRLLATKALAALGH